MSEEQSGCGGTENATGKPWRRILLVILGAFTTILYLVLMLLDVESLWEQGRVDVLATMMGACGAYWMAARLGPRKTMDQRFVIVTLLLIAIVGWMLSA